MSARVYLIRRPGSGISQQTATRYHWTRLHELGFLATACMGYGVDVSTAVEAHKVPTEQRCTAVACADEWTRHNA